MTLFGAIAQALRPMGGWHPAARVRRHLHALGRMARLDLGHRFTEESLSVHVDGGVRRYERIGCDCGRTFYVRDDFDGGGAEQFHRMMTDPEAWKGVKFVKRDAS